MPKGVDAQRTLIELKAPYLLGFRHKKRRPWTSLDGVMVEPGGLNICI
jgi:hypothetical protein